MPGRIVMDVQDSAMNGDPNKDHDHAIEGSQKLGDTFDKSSHPTFAMEGLMENGAQDGDAILANGVNHKVVEDIKMPSAEELEQSSRLPPELEHFTESYVPFGTLLERLAQQAYFDLNETIDGMADTAVQPQVNGAGAQSGHAAPDSSSTSVDKKLRLMNYAQNQKDRFIKALVLADWGRNMDDMNKLIELTMWLRRQDEMTQAASDGILGLKHNMIAAKMPNPNIEGALELLSTGKAPWMPDLGYIPPKPLTAQKLLQTLKDLDFVLSVRMNLHEEVPPQMSNYQIGNGRVTFEVAGEFEVDLATTDEDQTSPFYFIDMRFLFSPASPIKDDALRFEMESRVNEALAVKGLQGCYDWLHNFVLTYKINVLRGQAVELSRGKWDGCIRIEPVHRSLVISYWLDNAEGKNWLELGVASGKNATISYKLDQSPRISCRWYRSGQEVTDHDLDFDTSDLSMESILNQVVARHSSVRLEAIRDSIGKLAQHGDALLQQLVASDSNPNPEACYLRLRLESEAELQVFVEPIRGQLSIYPATMGFQKTAERTLAADTSITAGSVLCKVLCSTLLERIRKVAHGLKWMPVQREKQLNLKAIFGQDPVSMVVFRRDCWGSTWALAVTVNLGHGASWWIVEMSPGTDSQVVASAKPIGKAAFDRDALLALENSAVARISDACLRIELQRQYIACGQLPNTSIRDEPLVKDSLDQLEPPARQLNPSSHARESKPEVNRIRGSVTHDKDMSLPPLYIRPLDVLGDVARAGNHSCFTGFSKVIHDGFTTSAPESGVVHRLKGLLQRATAQGLIKYLAQGSTDSDMRFQPNGIFEVTIIGPLGGAILPTIKAKLRAIQRLCSFVRIARTYHFGIVRATPTSLEFCYSQEPLEFAALDVEDANDTTCTYLRLFSSLNTKEEGHTNPHFRIRTFLQNSINAPSATGHMPSEQSFESLCGHLRGTLPLLKTLNGLETADPAFRRHFTAHGALQYRLIYSTPLPSITFAITARSKDGQVKWHVEEMRRSQGGNETLRARLRGQVWDSTGASWIGIRNSAVADVAGISDLLETIDGVVSSMDAAAANAKPEGIGHGQANGTIVQKKDGKESNASVIKKGQKNHEIVVLD